MEIINPVLMFAFIMFVILFAPVLFTRIRLPGIVGLIFAGIVVGPHALGILKSEESFRLFSSVGLIYIMFLAGLEINLNEFIRQKKNSAGFGLLTFLIPMVIGTFGSKYLFAFSWPTAILLASMFASHTLIPFPITSRLGINKERSVVSTIGGTIITDTAAMLVLAIIAENATQNLTAVFWTRQIIFLIVFMWFALWALPRVAYPLFKIFAPDGRDEFLVTLTLVFLTAYLAHLAGVESIVGAFFAGLSLSRLISDQSPLKNRLEFLGHTFFIPFFLISVGMLVNLRVMLSGWEVWAMAMFMVTVAVFCKYAAAVIFAKFAKFTKDETYVIFGLSVNQAAATLAAVIVGLRLGIFDDEVLNGTIFMIFVTCLIGPWFTEKYGQKVAAQRKSSAISIIEIGHKIMLAVSRAESVEYLTDVALSLRPKESQEPIIPLHVVQDGVDTGQRILKGEKILGGVVSRIVASNVPVSPISRVDVNVSGGILRAFKEHHADILVLGSVLPQESKLKTMLFDISDKVCDESTQLLFLCQMARPLNLGKNCFVFIAPLLEHQEGFGRALESIKNLASTNKLRLNIIGLANTIQCTKMNSLWKESTVDVIFNSLDRWVECSVYLKKSGLQDADSVILMAARKGRLGWNPSLKRSFHNLGSEFPGNNIMMLYLPDADLYQTNNKDGTKMKNPGASALLTMPALCINRRYLEDAVSQLLEAQFPPGSKILSGIMENLSPLEPIELSSGIVLFHAHSEHLIEPAILLGTSKEGIASSLLKKKIHAFFILISPKGQTNIHLQSLTKVAQLAHDLELLGTNSGYIVYK
jgi:Kef-type K+ transport system membrane component KefB/mannitol/fructose-specific phosphotransferase system IIA component (Ntr-type)